MGRTTAQESAYQASLKAIKGGRTAPPTPLSRTPANASVILGSQSVTKSTNAVADAIAQYEARDKAAQEKVLGGYQQGENALRYSTERTAGETQVGTDQSLIGRGLYNTSVRDTAANQNAEVADASRLDIANQRSNLLGTMRPNPQVYGPLLATISQNRVFTKPGVATQDFASKFDAADVAAVDAQRNVYHGGADSAQGELNSNIANYNAGLGTNLKSRGLQGTGVQAAALRRSSERQQLGSENIAGQEANVEQQARPDPGLYGPLISQLAQKQVQPKSSIIGSVLPIAGAAAGGLIGGPGGAVIGGALGGAIGGKVNGTGYAQGAVSGYGYGSAIGGGFGQGGIFSGSGTGGGTQTSQINTGSGGGYDAYPTPNYKGGGGYTIPTSYRAYA